MFRIIGGGGPFGSVCDLPKFDGEWFDRGGGGGGGGFDPGPTSLEELFYTKYPKSDHRVSLERSARQWGGRAHLVPIPGTVEFVRCRVFRFESLRLEVGERRHRIVCRSTPSDGGCPSAQVPGEMRDTSEAIHCSGA